MNSRFLHKLRSKLFSPESKFELWARSIYHKLAATKLFFWIQDSLAKKSYRRWLAKQIRDSETMPSSFQYQPRTTFFVDATNGSQTQLSTTIASFTEIQGKNFEVLVAKTKNQELLDLPYESFPNSNLKIIDETQCFLEEITGDYIVFCQPGD